ncbi:malate dehydrogenase, NAD-dependent [Campylobacter pinnipediorum subsp. caledonicus]|uniref:Malate dehydrogenase, NAD-dependent n=1 Tax=Campylobacter pinnipediorum subsp. caledonicus TaxID=1874362 RepID=A0A1S6U792_9BACT|nr:malate dehydrogenase [Campylobacter pinnipediorum]AQW87618.1 malate dehydrogenase, NAD-dependent [Campylobacter pinnipediorum subsp. caledonicus]
MKISVIGAGNVGASVAYALSLKNVCKELVLIDIFADVAKVKAMDIYQANCVFENDCAVYGGDDYSLLKDSDVVVITAGSPRKDGQSREDLLIKNAEVVKTASENIKKYAPNSIIIVVTNPLDVMVWVAYNYSGFDKNKIIGMAGELDSARLIYEISNLKNIRANDIKAKVVGVHSDEMIVLKSSLNTKLNKDEFDKIEFETKGGGAKIVKLLKTSAFYAPAAGVVKMCLAIKDNKDEVLSTSVILSQELACGRLVRLSKDGICEILPLELDDDEKEKLKISEEKIINNIKFLKENLI